MKLAIAVLPLIFMMMLKVEISRTASVGHFRRDENDVVLLFQNLKAAMDKFRSILKAVLEDMPHTTAYNEYKLDLENFLQKYNEMKREMCLVKVFYIVGDVAELMEPYERRDATIEAKEVMTLFLNHGYKDFAEEQKTLARNIDTDRVMENIDNLEDRYMQKYKEFIKGC